jgi:hypothetical protein
MNHWARTSYVPPCRNEVISQTVSTRTQREAGRLLLSSFVSKTRPKFPGNPEIKVAQR